jgi:hypothetical protein
LRKHLPLFSLVFLVGTIPFVLQPIRAFAASSSPSLTDFRPIGAPGSTDPCLPLAADAETILSRHVRSRYNLPGFVAATARADPATVIGVFVCRVLALQVAQQPADDPVFVSQVPGTATQFRLAAQYGTIGLLAHSQWSGSKFFELVPGQEVYIVYGDGLVKSYEVSEVRHMRSLNPNDPYSDFLDLEHDSAQLSSVQVFNQVFAQSERVVFQTCIEHDASPTWGRLFVTATRVYDDRN